MHTLSTLKLSDTHRLGLLQLNVTLLLSYENCRIENFDNIVCWLVLAKLQF